MIYPIKWGRMESLLKKRFSTETEAKSPIFYFEDETLFYVYTRLRGVDIYSFIELKDLENIVAWKQEFLSQAEELLFRPEYKTTLVIRQE